MLARDAEQPFVNPLEQRPMPIDDPHPNDIPQDLPLTGSPPHPRDRFGQPDPRHLPPLSDPAAAAAIAQAAQRGTIGDPTDENYPQRLASTAARLEPDTAAINHEAALASIAISLKRIADQLDATERAKVRPPAPNAHGL